MDNQHRKITGYRELSQAEIDLMNEIKAVGAHLEALCEKVIMGTIGDIANLPAGTYSEGSCPCCDAFIWAESGKHDLQVGLMKLTRAVAQPTSF